MGIFSIFRKKKKETPSEKYLEEREFRDLQRKYKGKVPFTELARLGTREAFGVERDITRKGTLVKYEGEIYKVNKFTERGLHLQKVVQDKDFGYKELKTETFVPISKIEQGKVYHYPTMVTAYFTAIKV